MDDARLLAIDSDAATPAHSSSMIVRLFFVQAGNEHARRVLDEQLERLVRVFLVQDLVQLLDPTSRALDPSLPSGGEYLANDTKISRFARINRNDGFDQRRVLLTDERCDPFDDRIHHARPLHSTNPWEPPPTTTPLHGCQSRAR